MNMKIISTKFKDLKIIKLNNLNDLRGSFIKLFEKKNFFSNFKCIESYMSRSKKGTVRGLHAQKGKYSQEKIIFCIHGKVLDISIDLRKNSKTFGMHISTILSEKNSKSIFIPPGFAHGFCALSNENYIVYSCTKYREKKFEIGIKYNDKDLNIRWPVKKPIISKKDMYGLSFKEFKKKIKII